MTNKKIRKQILAALKRIEKTLDRRAKAAKAAKATTKPSKATPHAA